MTPPIEGISAEQRDENGPTINIFGTTPQKSDESKSDIKSSASQAQSDKIQNSLGRPSAKIQTVKHTIEYKTPQVSYLDPTVLAQQVKEEQNIIKLKDQKKIAEEQMILYTSLYSKHQKFQSSAINTEGLKLEGNNIRLIQEAEKNLQIIKNTIDQFTALVNDLDKRIKETPPPLVATKLTNNNLGIVSQIINKIAKKFFALVHFTLNFLEKKNVEYNKLNDLFGKYQQISREDYDSITQLLGSQQIRTNFSDYSTNNPMEVFKDLVDVSIEIRNRQLELLKNGSNALTMNSVIDKQINNEISQIQISDIYREANQLNTMIRSLADGLRDEKLKNSLLKTAKIMNAVIENAVPQNTQFVIDNLYPSSVIKDVKAFPKDSGNIISAIQLNIDSGKIYRSNNAKNSDGFLLTGPVGNLLMKTHWSKIATKRINDQKDTFIRGFCRVILRTPDNHQVESAALFDLSSFEKELTKEKVAKIFYFVSFYAEKVIDFPKNEKGLPLLEMTDDLKEISEQQKYIMMAANKILDEIALSPEKRAELVEIVHNFYQDLINASTLAFITAGHKRPNG